MSYDPAKIAILDAAHKHSSRHRVELLQSEVCGCFCCVTKFSPSAISCWTHDRDALSVTALCPNCGIDAVLGSASGLPITIDFLSKMRARWFGNPDDDEDEELVGSLMQIHTIDLRFQGVPGVIAAYLIEVGDEIALIETGPGSCHDALIAGIRALGHEPSAIKHVFVTHIHLDHSGAAGWWAQQGATVYCHPNAARHLIDPSRLIESARMVYGEAMDSLWGEILPAPADCVRVLQDNETVAIGETTITAWNTPGHARHHHAYIIGDVCFTGDVAGVRLENSGYTSVAAAPPQFDPDEYVQSVERLHGGGFARLYLTHFGEVRDVQSHLTSYAERIREVSACVKASLEDNETEDETRSRFQEAERSVAMRSGVHDDLWSVYERANSTAMCADGIRLYWQKKFAGK